MKYEMCCNVFNSWLLFSHPKNFGEAIARAYLSLNSLILGSFRARIRSQFLRGLNFQSIDNAVYFEWGMIILSRIIQDSLKFFTSKRLRNKRVSQEYMNQPDQLSFRHKFLNSRVVGNKLHSKAHWRLLHGPATPPSIQTVHQMHRQRCGSVCLNIVSILYCKHVK